MFRESTSQADRNASSGSALPRIIGVLALIGLVKMIASHKRGHARGSGWHERRRQMISELHRELHRQDDAKADAPDPKGTATA